MIKDFLDEYHRYRIISEKAMRQVPEDQLNQVLGVDNNSIATIVRHISGNLLSRFTDFLTSDGEKPWRDRDSEFEGKEFNRQQLEEMWARSWNLLESELSKLSDEQLAQRVLIRGHEWTVHEALCRSLAHVSYHVGQLVLVARILKEGEWDWISIPKGYSSEYNQHPTLEKKP